MRVDTRKLNPVSHTPDSKPAFCLVEVVTALIILAFISSSVLFIINRCLTSAADSTLRMQAFEIARENMEKLLSSGSIKLSADFGTSDKYQDIKWQTSIETFYEPVTSRMWIKGICSTEYTDTEGQTQTVELTHWLTDVSKQQLLELMKQQQDQGQANQIIETLEEAAEYAGVDVPTIQQWIQNGLLTTDDGSFIKKNVDIFKNSNGNPPPEVKSQQAESVKDLTEPTAKQPKTDKQPGEKPDKQKPPDQGDQTEPKSQENEPDIPEQKIYTEDDLRDLGFPEELIPTCLRLLNSD